MERLCLAEWGTHMAKLQVAFGVVVILALASFTASSSTATSNEVRTTLSDGAERVVSANGTVAVGSPGITISDSTGSAVSSSSVSTPDDGSKTVQEMADAYAASGRSTIKDTINMGGSDSFVRYLRNHPTTVTDASTQSGRVYDSICVQDNSDAVDWAGCVTRYLVSDSDPSYNYGIDVAQATGHETSDYYWNDLHLGGVVNFHRAHVGQITSIAPGSDINNVSQCYNSGFNVTAFGFGAGTSGTVCPEWWDMDRVLGPAYPAYHRVDWRGESNADREAVAATGFRKMSQYWLPGTYALGIRWDVH